MAGKAKKDAGWYKVRPWRKWHKPTKEDIFFAVDF